MTAKMITKEGDVYWHITLKEMLAKGFGVNRHTFDSGMIYREDSPGLIFENGDTQWKSWPYDGPMLQANPRVGQ